MELLLWLLDDVESAASLVFMKRPPWLFRGCRYWSFYVCRCLETGPYYNLNIEFALFNPWI